MMQLAGIELWRAKEALKSSNLAAVSFPDGREERDPDQGVAHTIERERRRSAGAGPCGQSTPGLPFPCIPQEMNETRGIRSKFARFRRVV